MVERKSNPTARLAWWVGGVAMLMLAISLIMPRQPADKTIREVRVGSSDGGKSIPSSPAGTAARFVTTVRRPGGPPVIELEHADPQGRVGSVACSTCHSVREPNFANRGPADLDQFHQNMPMAHRTLACYSCHNPQDMDTLRLADSTVVEYPDVMTLCAQCHGPQSRDYEHGAHGGMTGYWDLSRGPRLRNHCIDCHDPHVPEFPSMRPVFKPRDRFLQPAATHTDATPSRLAPDEIDHE